MSKIVASADITLLDFSVLIDLSTATPVASVTNMSTVVTAANLKWIFELYSPSGTPLYVGNFDTPDVNGVAFTTFQFPNPIQQSFGQIEFGAEPYLVKVSVMDSDDNVFDLSKSASLCKPNGNTGKNNFGAAAVSIKPRCAQKNLFVTDQTNLIYKGKVGTKITSSATLRYPIDPNGNSLADVTITTLPGIFPLQYEGPGHEVYVYHVYEYDLGDSFTVRIRYSFKQVFPVWCNVTLEPLFCEIDRLGAIVDKDCSDTVDSRNNQKTLLLAQAKLQKAVVGLLQPLSGFDVPKIIEEIKELLVIECDCCPPAGISNIGVGLATDAVYSANITCGDITASFDNDDNGNIVLNIGNKIYTFEMSEDPTSSQAFEWSIGATGGCTKVVTLFVNKIDLATEILTEIQNNPTLLNILNAITQRAQLTCTGLSGGAAFNLSSCDFSVEINTSATGKVFESIQIGGTTYSAPGGTLVTDASGIGTFLNSLAKGTFVVVYSSGTNRTTITSAANSFPLSTIKTKLGSAPSLTQQINSNCGYICNILQTIFNYLNAIGLINVKTGLEMSVCRFNPDGTIFQTVFADTTKSLDFIKFMNDSICNIATFASTRLLSCENLKALFATFTVTTGNPTGADIAFMSLAGKCQQVPMKNLAISIFNLLGSDVDVKNAYCAYAKCDSIGTCSPVTSLASSISSTSTTFTWNSVVGATGYAWSLNGGAFNSVSATSVLLSGLTASTAYTFRVYPVYASGPGVSCTVVQNFTTTSGSGCAAPGSLVLSNVTATSFRANWAAVTGASGYRYRVNGGSWISVGTSLTIVLSGLTPDTAYNFEVNALIGGTPCIETSDDDVTTDTATDFSLSNDVTGATISFVGTGAGGAVFAITEGALPVGPGENVQGTHDTFTNTVKITVTGSTFVTSCATLTVDGVFIQSVAVPANTPADYTFSSRVYGADEQINIILTPGTCGA